MGWFNGGRVAVELEAVVVVVVGELVEVREWSSCAEVSS